MRLLRPCPPPVVNHSQPKGCPVHGAPLSARWASSRSELAAAARYRGRARPPRSYAATDQPSRPDAGLGSALRRGLTAAGVTHGGLGHISKVGNASAQQEEPPLHHIAGRNDPFVGLSRFVSFMEEARSATGPRSTCGPSPALLARPAPIPPRPRQLD